MMKVASKETEKTNVRVNEVYLNARVDYDEVAEKQGTMKASDFGKVYEQILARPELKGCRVSVKGEEDVEELKWRPTIGIEPAKSVESTIQRLDGK